ncbi:MAG: c-type cytochrome, partial [Thermoanaerobaculia bacterium]
AAFAVDRSVARRAPRTANPVGATPDTRAAGLRHYRAMCVTCHGAPGIDASEIGEGLNPPAPDLTLPRVQGRTDGELFWLVQNGLRMTGMPAFGPTHPEEEIWKIVAFMRHLPELTPEEEKALTGEPGAD